MTLMAPDPTQIPVAELLPHAPPMVLLDRVLRTDGDCLDAELSIRADSEFCVDDRVGIWVGIEYMAQAVAAWSGWQARLRQQPVKVGFLLGARRYLCHVDHFAVGDRLIVRVQREFQADNGLARFQGRVERDGECCAEASISVYEPPPEG